MRLSISHLHSAPKKHNGGTVTPDVRAPEGSRVSEVSDEGVRLGVSSSEVSVEAQLCGAAYAFSQLESSRGQWQIPCSAQAKIELKTELFRHHVTALSHSDNEFLRRSLGSSSFPPPSPFSSLRRPAWRFWQFFCFLPFWHCCLFGIVAFLALLPFGSPPPPAACSARPAGVALSISHLYPAPKHN